MCRTLCSSTATLAGAPAGEIGSAVGWKGGCKRPRSVVALMAIATMLVSGYPARAENGEISLRRSLERTSFTNNEIMDGFFKVAFGAELQTGARAERIRKFDGPVRVFVEQGTADRRAEIATVIADIR